MTQQPDPLHVQEFLTGVVDYPVSKEQLVRNAEQAGADDEVLRALRTLPDRTYDGADAVSAEVAQGT